MSNQEIAKENFNEGRNLNCSQAVFSAFSEQYGLDAKTARKTAAAFGGGLGRTQGICGAVSGALMVIGLKYYSDENSSETKNLCYQKARDFMEAFVAKRGSAVCRDLLGTDLDEAKKQNLFATVCPDAVSTAAEILEDLIK